MFCGPRILHYAFLLKGETHFFILFDEKLIFKKRLGVATYFCFIFKGKPNKKENPKCNSLFGKKKVYKKPTLGSRVRLLIGKVQ